ncbi:hypothetical protein [Novilysobacter avium]|uniref:RNA polymerase sigma factor 70 region 4 type 2 domain-containing protein n=1 Tax=Novilysobacter avium TaxID=2781023 RepID=A0A7S6ZUL1_9GAMM|nr:hypothetical protein [Lysobacter avium]QOW22232.1 hypothetical protein INQ42_00995 [Lysobacter avium]
MTDPSAVPGARSVSAVTPGARAPAALAAFLRGVERRGAVLAELQCGDATTGDAALADAMRQFRHQAGATVMDDWPRQFWAVLLAQPALKQRTPVAIAVDATDRLGELGSGPRAALLLRLAAGLDQAGAAAVLGVRTQTYRLALQRSLPHHPDGRADPHAWQALREQVHRRIKTLPGGRLDRLAKAREAALSGGSTATAAAVGSDRPAAMHARPAWLMPLLWSLLALCVLAMALSFLPSSLKPGGAARSTDASGALDEQPPASRYSEEAAAVMHRDFDLLADPQGVAAAVDLPFHAWLAARADEMPASDPVRAEAETGAEAMVDDVIETAGGETSDEID